MGRGIRRGYGGPLTESEAHSGSPASRVGHHNDCFLASDTDWGTYPSDEIEYWKNYLEADCLFVPNGGETCNPNPPRSECAVALFEMERRLGYRLALLEVGYPEQASPGGVLPLDLRDDPRYAIRLANQDTWDAATGFNRLATVTLDPSAPGSTDPRAERFEAIE